MFAPSLHTRQRFGVFGGDRGGRDFRRTLVVSHRAGMGRL
jgi:hypothetical protein